MTFNVSLNCLTKMVPSFNNELLALSTDTGYLIMCTSDLTRIIHRYKSENLRPVREVAWVSSSAVMGFWDSLYLIPLGGDDQTNHSEM